MGEAVMESLKNCLSQTKKIGTQRIEKQNIHETLKHATMVALSKKYKLQGKLRISLNLGKNKHKENRWKVVFAKNRKRRKDRICIELKEKVKDYLLDPAISRQVPCKREVVNLKESGQNEISEKHIIQDNISWSVSTWLQTKHSPAHTFRASWQHEHMSPCIKKLKEDQVIMIKDFAEN